MCDMKADNNAPNRQNSTNFVSIERLFYSGSTPSYVSCFTNCSLHIPSTHTLASIELLSVRHTFLCVFLLCGIRRLYHTLRFGMSYATFL